MTEDELYRLVDEFYESIGCVPDKLDIKFIVMCVIDQEYREGVIRVNDPKNMDLLVSFLRWFKIKLRKYILQDALTVI